MQLYQGDTALEEEKQKRQSETNRDSNRQTDTETASATSICHNPGTLLRAVSFSPTVLWHSIFGESNRHMHTIQLYQQTCTQVFLNNKQPNAKRISTIAVWDRGEKKRLCEKLSCKQQTVSLVLAREIGWQGWCFETQGGGIHKGRLS